MTDSPRVPRALGVVALLFLLEGLRAAISICLSVRAHRFYLDLDLLSIPTSFGLWRLSRGWRGYALFCTWLGMIGYPIASIYVLTKSHPLAASRFGTVVGEVTPIHASLAFIPYFLLSLWEYRVLTRSDVKDLFLGKDQKLGPTAAASAPRTPEVR